MIHTGPAFGDPQLAWRRHTQQQINWKNPEKSGEVRQIKRTNARNPIMKRKVRYNRIRRTVKLDEHV